MTWALRTELSLLVLMAAAGAASIPLSTGFMAWSWDALNHHVYLGMVAEAPRWHLDVVAASFQSYQYPYLYWPVYRMSLLSGSGAHIGAIWSAAQAALVLPPVWLLARQLLPQQGSAWQLAAERILACAMAFASGVVLTTLETTGNDVLAAVPLLWALVLGLRPAPGLPHIFCAALLTGVAVAFKLSNAIFVPMLAVFWWQSAKPHWPLNRALVMALGSSLGFFMAYAPWGVQLWQATGNPFHPFFDGFFNARP